MDYSNLNENLEKENIIPIFNSNSSKNENSQKQLIFIQADSQFQDPQNKIFIAFQTKYGNYKSMRSFPEIYKVFLYKLD